MTIAPDPVSPVQPTPAEPIPSGTSSAPESAPAAPPRPPRARGATRAAALGAAELLRKPVNTLAIVPKSARITLLGRKSYNVLLYEAQEQGLDREVFRAPLERIIRGVDFDSNDHALIKKHLRAMVSTTVEWQSPTTGEGSSWNISGLLAHAKLSKERGQVWVEWSYAVNLKQELLEPTVFARLKLEVISQLRSHAAVALYEICTRYKDVGRTARQEWRWWRPVLTGQPETERTQRLEYRVFKRDTLKLAVAEVNAITDLDVALIEHRQGRFVAEIQFSTAPKKQASLPLTQPPRPVDLGLTSQAIGLGVAEEALEALLRLHGEPALRDGLEALARRVASAFPEPLRDPLRYLRSLLPAQAPRAALAAPGAAAPEATQAAGPDRGLTRQARAGTPAAGANAAPSVGATGDVRVDAPIDAPIDAPAAARRHARWHAEWLRRRRDQITQALAAQSAEAQARLAADLLHDMLARHVHPSICKRLQTSGWQHPLVLPEMLRYYAVGAYGDGWDQPGAEQLLAVAAQMGEGG